MFWHRTGDGTMMAVCDFRVSGRRYTDVVSLRAVASGMWRVFSEDYWDLDAQAFSADSEERALEEADLIVNRFLDSLGAE